MRTKLSRYADGIMETAWLSATILVPLFFNVYSSRIFEPDKITMLRSLALVIAVAWLIKVVEQGGMDWEHIPVDKYGLNSRFRSLLRIPMILPVLALVFVYILATLFSISPRISFWGSYQRLQGTYTTFSYIIIFAALTANLRRREQVTRLITTVILCSLPVSLYGVLQRYRIDPVPWGGDVTARIASNMGNSIFVAAYLITVFPLTVVRIVDSFMNILRESTRLAFHVTRATIYVFIAALQVIALLFSGSRGPLLGWLAGTFFLLIVLTLLWRRRLLTVGVIGTAVLVGGFLLLLNIQNGPLEGLRATPGIGRLGHLLDEESKTSLVRTYIWRGAQKLFLPHQPLEYPDGSNDSFNIIRPLIGYGPESMYVAYNPFYPPELTQVEKRNASPDRSHNETWDSLVITGVLGFLAYLGLFTAVFYYSLKWLGLITSSKQHFLFFGLYFGVGIASAIVFMIWKEIGYFGVGLPFGCLIGMLAYLILISLFGKYEIPKTPGEQIRALTLAGLLAVIIAHFAEINFGIAIAVTRTYFWTFSGLLLLIGYILPLHGEYESSTKATVPEKGEGGSRIDKGASAYDKSIRDGSSRKKQRHPSKEKPRSSWARNWPDWIKSSLVSGIILAIILTALGYDFISNAFQVKSAGAIVWNSLVHLRSTSSPVSYGVLAMILTTWLAGSVLFASENRSGDNISGWIKQIGATLGISLILGLLFWLWHAGNIASLLSTPAKNMAEVISQVGRYENLLTLFYIFIFILIFAGGVVMPDEWPAKTIKDRWLSPFFAPAMVVLAILIVSITNLRVIQADIAFKAADPFTKQNAWAVAIGIYNHANELAPNEDFYYLFLGRAYLEQGRALTDAKEREKLFEQAQVDLIKAQTLDPLNIDHTANLARLNSLWAIYTTDQDLRSKRNLASDDYFAKAVLIAPNNARIWDEWALLYLNNLKQPEEAFQRIVKSKEIDPYYDWSYGLLGDYYAQRAQATTDPVEKNTYLQQSIEGYSQALKLAIATDTRSQYNYTVALAGVYVQLEQLQMAIETYQQAISLYPGNTDIWRIEYTLTQIYYQLGDTQNALIHAENALAGAPDAQKDNLRKLINQISGQP